MTEYKPGLHILSVFSSATEQLTDSGFCKQVFDELIAELSLQKVGEVYHVFPNGGFTAVVCLTESHVSIHTWPEYKTATFDVFLSNFERDNSEKVRSFSKKTIQLFNASVISQQEIWR
jgi:S-adenosylmethionine decarboxylase